MPSIPNSNRTLKPRNFPYKSYILREADKTNEIDQRWGGEFEKSGEAPANATTETKEGEPEAEQAPVEEEPKELTLDEWKAQRAGRQKPQFNIRKAGEGEDPSQWKKMYELNKKKNGNEEIVSLFAGFSCWLVLIVHLKKDSDDEEYDASEYPQRVGRQKHLLDIDIHFNDARRSGGGGGGGGGRGGRGPRSGPRSNRNNQKGEKQGARYRGNEEQVSGSSMIVMLHLYNGVFQGEERQENRNEPKFDDERDFPSLG